MSPTPPRLETIDYRDLRLDTENPRHRTQPDEPSTLAALIRDDAPKLVALAIDISKNGLDPINPLLVLPQGDTYVVLEGNRRLAALHLLSGRGTEHLSNSQRRSLAANDNFDNEMAVQCVVVESRSDARHWIELRHTGQNEGAGVVPWSATQIARFRPGNTQAHKGLAFLELARSLFPDDARIESACETIEHDKITNLGRLAGDPDVRERLGVELEADNEYELDDTEQAAASRVRILVLNLADDTSVAELINKDRRLEYIERVLGALASAQPIIDNGATPTNDNSRGTTGSTATEGQDDSPREEGDGTTHTGREIRTSTSTRNSSPRQVFQGLDLSALDERVDQINQEVQSLQLERYPNTVAILIRCLLDMAVESFLAEAKVSPENSFAERVLQAAAILDPNDSPRQQDPRLRAVRAWMNSDEHLFSAATLHQFVHNPQWHPVPQDLVAIASNLQPFLTLLNRASAQ